jgi:quercetin dioxygenase-like cupin family protein
MLRFKTLIGLAALLAGAVAIACNEGVGPETVSGGRGASLETEAVTAFEIPETGAARGTLDPGVKIKTHPTRPTDVVSVVIRLDGDGDGKVNGIDAPTHLRWHTHPGPAIVVVTGGAGSAVTIHHAGSCEKHVYAPGDAFVEEAMVHSAWNESGQDLVLRGTLLIPVGAAPTTFEPAEFTDCGLP